MREDSKDPGPRGREEPGYEQNGGRSGRSRNRRKGQRSGKPATIVGRKGRSMRVDNSFCDASTG